MSTYSAGTSVRGVSSSDALGITSNLLPYDMGGFRINTEYPIGVAPTATGLFSIALGPYNLVTPTANPIALGVKSIAIGSGGTRADGDYSISIGESTNYQGFVFAKPSGASSIAVGSIDAQAADSIAIGVGILGPTWGDGFPGVIDTATGAITIGYRGVQNIAHGIMMGTNNSGLNRNPFGVYVAPTSRVMIGAPTLGAAADPVSNSTLIGYNCTVRANQVMIGTSLNTGARGIHADDLKTACWGQGSIMAEFNWNFARTAGKTDNKGLLDVAAGVPYSLSAADMRNNVFRYSNAVGALALTTPTAVAILATLPSYQIDGDGFLWQCIAETQNVVLTAGVGVTIDDAGWTSLTANQINSGTSSQWLVQRTGAATVKMTRMWNGAY